jgi:solute carrier family 25 (adenine nucleotide translocator) protein 4/5/6/31
MIYRGFYFGIYDTLRTKFDDDTAIWWKFTVGFMSTTVGAVVVYPMDTARRRNMMQAGKSAEQIQYKGSVDAVMQIVQKEGIAALYKGGLTNIFRSAGGSVLLVAYDEMQKLFVKKRF